MAERPKLSKSAENVLYGLPTEITVGQDEQNTFRLVYEGRITEELERNKTNVDKQASL